MNDRSFTKLFSCIVTSSMWSEDSDTRVVWVTMLALANRDGEVLAAIPGLARASNVSLEATQTAINKFLAPDQFSRTSDFEGRRIEIIPGGWRLLNYDLYRSKMDEEDRKSYKARKEKERRSRIKARGHNVDKRGQNGHIAEAEAEAEAEAGTASRPGLPVPKPVKSGLPEEAEFWNSHCGTLPKVLTMGPTRMKHLENRRRDPFWKEHFKDAVEKVKISDFCNGKIGQRGWMASFDWMIERPTSVAKIMEGKYDNRLPDQKPNNGGIDHPVASRIALERHRDRLQKQFDALEPQYDWERTQERMTKRKNLRMEIENLDAKIAELLPR